MADEQINRYNPETKKWERVAKTAQYDVSAIGSGSVPVPLTTNNSAVDDKSGFSVPRYHGGSVRSVNVLNMLRFDPIEELVTAYRKLQAELTWHEQLRSNDLIPLKADGSIRHYSVDAHMRVYEQMQGIAKELLRYGYGRVPETIDLNINRPSKLVINLTKKGEAFEINNQEDINGD